MLNRLFGGTALRVDLAEFPDPLEDEAADGVQASRLAVLAGGCFWCVEAVYRELAGVQRVVSGYSGGDRESADYQTVCSGTTEHAEVVQIVYDPSRTSFGQLLKIFFSVAHDPTQLNRQGNDVGAQYRSAIFYVDAEQKRVAEAYIRQLEAAGVFGARIVTRLEPLQEFFEAEAYHQNYAELHPDQPYIAAVAAPKVDKLRHYFGERLKS